jgi:hypothetical protein
VPDAYALAEAGVDTGLRALAAGEEFSTRIHIRLRA